MASKKKSMAPETRAKRAKGAMVKSARKKAAKPAKRAATAGRLNQWLQKYTQIFGPPFPKGKVLNAAGEYITLRAAAREELCVLQCEPRPNRMGWVYVTQGLCPAAQPQRVEVLLHWKERDTKLPVKILSELAQYIRQGGKVPAPGEMVSDEENLKVSSGGFRHWLVCPPEKTVPEFIESSEGKATFVVLLGVSDDEKQCALKVNAGLADGRKVLFHALKTGGVFPLSDPERPCLTRRRDFQRLWENSFRLVRDRRV